jgi:hypothetical protein
VDCPWRTPGWRSSSDAPEAPTTFSPAGYLDGLEQQIIDTRAEVAGEIESLNAQKEMLAARDREARNELERLRMTRHS